MKVFKEILIIAFWGTFIAYIFLQTINARADNYLTMTIASKHFVDKDQNETNLGLGVNVDHWIVGVYDHSHNDMATYAGYHYEERLDNIYSVGFQMGMVHGYDEKKLNRLRIGKWNLYIFPDLIIKHNKYVRSLIGVIPSKNGAVTYQMEIAL